MRTRARGPALATPRSLVDADARTSSQSLGFTRVLGRCGGCVLLALARARVAGHRVAGQGGRRQTVGLYSAPRIAVRPNARPRRPSARALD